ncbi:MAG TPA: ABC transporter permease [Candidatus Bathyarchaeia archaeon]|nr:ABC transporter permease [Candidatus Bathyarchaeia archaeon]
MNFGAIFAAGAFNIPGLNIPKEVLNSISQQLVQSTFGTNDYFSFLAVGMLSFVALFTAMYSGMSIVWDRRLGFLNKLPVIRGLTQSAVVFVIAILLGLDLSHITILGVIGTFVALFFMLLGLSSLFVMLATRSKSWESQTAIMNLLNLPLLFASNALFPEKFVPSWLPPIVRINPISYATDVARQLLLGATGMASLTFDFTYLTAFAVCLSVLGMYMPWKFLTK